MPVVCLYACGWVCMFIVYILWMFECIHLLCTPRYNDLKKSLGRNMSDAVEDLLTNFDSEFVVGRFGGDGEGMEPRKTPLVTDDEEVFFQSSILQTDRMF